MKPTPHDSNTDSVSFAISIYNTQYVVLSQYQS